MGKLIDSLTSTLNTGIQTQINLLTTERASILDKVGAVLSDEQKALVTQGLDVQVASLQETLKDSADASLQAVLEELMEEIDSEEPHRVTLSMYPNADGEMVFQKTIVKVEPKKLSTTGSRKNMVTLYTGKNGVGWGAFPAKHYFKLVQTPPEFERLVGDIYSSKEFKKLADVPAGVNTTEGVLGYADRMGWVLESVDPKHTGDKVVVK